MSRAIALRLAAFQKRRKADAAEARLRAARTQRYWDMKATLERGPPKPGLFYWIDEPPPFTFTLRGGFVATGRDSARVIEWPIHGKFRP